MKTFLTIWNKKPLVTTTWVRSMNNTKLKCSKRYQPCKRTKSSWPIKSAKSRNTSKRFSPESSKWKGKSTNIKHNYKTPLRRSLKRKKKWWISNKGFRRCKTKTNNWRTKSKKLYRLITTNFIARSFNSRIWPNRSLKGTNSKFRSIMSDPTWRSRRF